MNREFAITARKTYAVKQNAQRAVLKAGVEDVRHFYMTDPETGRWFPVFVGQEAVQRGIHFLFNVVG